MVCALFTNYENISYTSVTLLVVLTLEVGVASGDHHLKEDLHTPELLPRYKKTVWKCSVL